MSPQKPKPDLPWIDGLRAVSAIGILLFHLNPVITAFFGTIPLLGLGYFGVDVFFAISGFLVFYHHGDELINRDASAYRRFLASRLVRIYPVHLFVLLLLAALVHWAPAFGFTINNPQDYTREDFIKHLLLISAWSFPAKMSWNYYAWAISALWMTYLVSPTFVRLIKRIENNRGFITAMIMLIIAVVGVRIIQPYDSFVAYALFRAIAGFGMGMLLCGLFQKTSMPETSFGRQQFLQYVAKISYSLYMVQFIVIMIAKKAFPIEMYKDASTTVHMLYLFLEIAVVFAAGIATYYLVETPARRFFSKKIR